MLGMLGNGLEVVLEVLLELFLVFCWNCFWWYFGRWSDTVCDTVVDFST